MKKFKEFVIAILLLAAVGSLIYFMYQRASTKTNRELAKRMAEISPRGNVPETIDGLRRAIALYEDQIERNVREGAQTGVYWKILGLRLADRNMHNDALEAFERAIYYNTEDPVLYYLTGVSAASVAKSTVGFSPNSQMDREKFYILAENSYLRALDIDVTYTKPMYALGVLYAFELDGRAQEAIVQLERYLQILPNEIPAMFVLARANVMTENYSRAIDIYDRIIDRTKDRKFASIREEAQINRDAVQGFLYE